MTEFNGLAYFAEIPPPSSTCSAAGLRRHADAHQQAEHFCLCLCSNGDTKHVLLFPRRPEGVFDFAAEALDLADRLQTPIFVMTDLDIGMNQRSASRWNGRRPPVRPWQGDDRRPSFEAGKRTSAVTSTSTATGIPFRTYPGTHPKRGDLFITRGTTKDR